MPLTRRHFLSRSSLVAASSLGWPAVLSANSVNSSSGCSESTAKPRRIIHLVADGMGLGTLTCSDMLSQISGQRGLTWLRLYSLPEVTSAFMNMRSLNSVVTDSAAASSSWGSGSRVVNGALNQLPDGHKLLTLYQLFDQAGWRRGLVTTTEITHATPAGFAINNSKRDNADEIAVQYLDRRVDVLLGGGSKFFDPAKRKDKRNLLDDFKKAGYVTMKSLSELDSASANSRWLGVFTDSHLPYTLDHIHSEKDLKQVPTLAHMTRRALENLRQNDHFILQVEGGRVDHACHSCDAAAAFRDLIAFDEAIDVCLEFQKEHPDTLIVITTDHGTGNPCLNGMGKEYGSSSKLFANLLRIKQSSSRILDRLGTPDNAQWTRDVIGDLTGYKLSAQKAAQFTEFLHEKGTTIYEDMNSASTQFGQLLGNYTGVGWSGSMHTSDYVPLLALGPGSSRFRGFLQNTDIFKHYLALASIDFQNRSASLLAEAGPEAFEVEPIHSYELA